MKEYEGMPGTDRHDSRDLYDQDAFEKVLDQETAKKVGAEAVALALLLRD